METPPSPSKDDASSSKSSYEVSFRLAEEKDIPFIKDTYSESFKDAPASRHIHAPIYKKGARRTIDALRARAACYVVTPPLYPDLLLGWAIVEATPGGVGGDACIHYVYVKKAYRKAGVSTALVSFLLSLLNIGAESDIRFSHWRLPAGKIARRHNWRFDPYQIIDGARDETESSSL